MEQRATPPGPPESAPPESAPTTPRRDRTRLIVAVLLILVGLVWAAQGAGAPIGGGLMVGNPFWIWAGAAVVVAGLLVAFWPRLRGR